MKVTTYCFLPGTRFDPLPKQFSVKDGVAWISNDYEPNTGQKKQEIVGCSLSYETTAKIDDFIRQPDDPKDPEHKAQFKQIGDLLDRSRGELNEVATMIEGLVSLMTIKPFPAFLIGHVNVRLTAESPEEQKMIDEEKVHHTFGDIGKTRSNPIGVVGGADDILKYSTKASERLSALSIYTLATRAEERYEFEIAYSNFFRIIEGYLGDGTPHIENALKTKANEILKLIKPNEDFFKALKAILSHLKLPQKAKSISDGEGIVADLVLLRHKLMHYNLTNQDRHFYSSMRVDLKIVSLGLHRAAFFLLREDIEERIIPEQAPPLAE